MSAESERPSFRKVDERLLHRGRFDIVAVDVEAPDGSTVTRQIMRHPGAVAVVPFDGQDVLLVRQYRAAVDAWMLEIPAGKLDPGPDGPEDPAECARRELAEEIGRVPGRLEQLADFAAAPGWCDERVWVFLGTELEVVEAHPQGLEESHMEVVRVPFAEALQMIRDGRICDAKSLVGLLLVAPRIGVQGIGG